MATWGKTSTYPETAPATAPDAPAPAPEPAAGPAPAPAPAPATTPAPAKKSAFEVLLAPKKKPGPLPAAAKHGGRVRDHLGRPKTWVQTAGKVVDHPTHKWGQYEGAWVGIDDNNPNAEPIPADNRAVVRGARARARAPRTLLSHLALSRRRRPA